MKAAAALLMIMALKLVSNKVDMKSTEDGAVDTDMGGAGDVGGETEKDKPISTQKGMSKEEDSGVKRGCAGQIEEYNEAEKKVERLSYRDLYDLLKYNRTDFVLVDVRTPKEYADGHIPASFLVTITNGKFEEYIDFRQILCSRKFVVLYCRSGRRALTAANLLKSQIPVKLYPGSWIEWSSKNPRNIVPYVKKRM